MNFHRQKKDTMQEQATRGKGKNGTIFFKKMQKWRKPMKYGNRDREM